MYRRGFSFFCPASIYIALLNGGPESNFETWFPYFLPDICQHKQISPHFTTKLEG